MKVSIKDKDTNELNNFKGMYYNDQHETKYYEGGAHFKYKELIKKLESIADNKIINDNTNIIKQGTNYTY